MARRRTKSLQRKMQPDFRYKSELITKFINTMMLDGKKAVAESSFYDALNFAKEKTEEDGFDIFKKAILNVKPQVEVKSRRVGGVTYQVPVEVYTIRQQSLAIRWIIRAARDRSGKSFTQKLGQELIDAASNAGGAIKKKEEVKRMADANRAFAHYAW